MNAYGKTNREFKGNPTKMNEAWDETVSNLSRFDPTSTTGQLEAHAYVSILEQILFAAASSNGT